MRVSFGVIAGMAKLMTHHDKFHVHAILGVTALLHFFYRFGYLFIFRRESFQPDVKSAVMLGVHFCLHATSFQFELPRNRMWTKPMIWREFRVHNAIFAYRNLIGAIFGIWFADWWWRSPDVFSVAAKVALILLGCYAADLATSRIGSEDDRTTNAMPYPSKTGENLEMTAKWFYAKSQFAATAFAAFGTPSLSFCSLLAIEIASFLMTLVRKGVLEAHHYHIFYALSLFVMFPAIVTTLHSGDDVATMAVCRALCVSFVSIELRLTYRWNKYLVWCISIVAGAIFPFEGVNMYVYVKYLAWIGMMWAACDTLMTLNTARCKEQQDRLSSARGKKEATASAASPEATAERLIARGGS